MSENSKPIVKDTARDAKQELDDFLSPISAKMFKPASITQQATELPEKTINKPIAEPTKEQAKKASKANPKANSKKTVCRGRGQQRKIKTDKLQSKASLLNASNLKQLDLVNFNVEELEAMAQDLLNPSFSRIPINKQILYGLKLASGSKKNMHELGNIMGLLFLQLFRPDILEAIQKMPPQK